MTIMLSTTGALVLSLSATAGLAQVGTAAPTAISPAAQTTAGPAESPVGTAESTAGIADIVVTAQRRTENLQRTALAVSAVDGAALRQAGVSQPQDLTKLIPALQLSSLGGGGTQVNIRGVGNFAPFLYSEPAIAINYDGVYLARSAAPNGLFFDLERVEVLKGPQGTLYGRNATGGAINVISNKPKLGELTGTISAEFGSYDLKRGTAAINLPVSTTVAVRIAAQAIDRSGYLSDGYLDDVGQAVRGQILFAPNDAVRLILEADYIHQGGKGAGGVFATGPDTFVNPRPYDGASSPASQGVLRGASLGITNGGNPNFLPPFGTDGFTNLDEYGTSLTADVDLGGVKLTVIPAYRHTHNSFKHYVGGFPLVSTENSDQETVEARLASDNGSRLKWVVGGYYFHDASSLFAFADQGLTRSTQIAPSLPVDSIAAFGQATYSLTDTFRVTGGLRYTDETKSQTGTNIGSLPPVPTGFPAPAIVFYGIACPAPGIIDLAGGNCTAPFSGHVHYSKLTYKAGVEADLGPRSLAYASVESGFKAGGFYPSLAPNTFAPEKIFAVTVGSKNRFADNRVQLNLEAFYWDYTDKQVTHLGPIRPSGYTLITENAGAATLYGTEADLIWQPTKNDRLAANVQYLHSRYDRFTYTVPILSADPTARAAVSCPAPIATNPQTGAKFATVDCSGNRLPQTPEWTATLSYQHDFVLSNAAKIEALAGTKIQSKYFTGEEYLPGQLQTASTVSYATLTYRAPDDRFSLSAYVDNIEDAAVKSSSFVQPAVGIPLVVLRAPRTYGVRGSYRF